MSFEMPDLEVLSQGIAKVIRGKRARNAGVQDKLRDSFFEECKAGDYDDDEGDLRKSFDQGSKNRIEERQGDSMVLGTRVYYGIMVEEGHVIGVRDKRHNHRSKRSGKRKGGYSVNKGFAPGRFFMEKAMQKADQDLEALGNELFDAIGKEIGL